MPDVFIPVFEVASRILDPLIRQISDAVLRQLSIREYFQDSIYLHTNRSASSLSDDGRGNINLSRNRCDITVEDILNPAGVPWDMAVEANQTAYGSSPRYRGQYPVIFYDEVGKVAIFEHTMPAALSFTFTLKFRSFDAAQLAFSMMLGQHHGTLVNTVHDVVYTYPVPMRLLIALAVVFNRRASFTGDFNAYLSQFASVQWERDIRKLDIGSATPEFQLVVKRHQLRCQALLEFSQSEPEVNRVDNLAASYNVEFTYKVQFGRPNMLQLTLPVSVENQPLPEALFCKQITNAVDFIQGQLQVMCFAEFIQATQWYRPPPILLRLPSYDDFVPPQNGLLTTAKFLPFVSAALTLDNPGPTVINFQTLNEYALHPTVVAIINLHSATDLLGYQGIFNLTVFADDCPLDPSLLTVDTTAMTVTIAATLTTKVYRLMLSEATAIPWLDPKWYPTLLKYRFFFPMTLARNLNLELADDAVQITADPNLVTLIQSLMQRNLLNPIIQNWITAQEASYEIYSYTQTAQQFGDYISLTPAGQTADATLYDLFIQVCLTDNYITTANEPTRSLRTPIGYPYGPGQGGTYAFNIPLRIFNTTIKPTNTTTTAA